MRHRALLVGLLLSFAVLTILAARPAIAQTAPTPDPSAQITSPVAGGNLFGVVPIVGTANNATMQTYGLAYLQQAATNPTWQPLAGPIAQKVKDNTLGQWDTTKLPDGIYQVRLRVTLRNGTVLEAYARDLRINNQPPTVLPTLPPPATVTLTPTLGPTPTPLFVQPPTLTPQAANIAVPTEPPLAPTSDSSIAADVPATTLSFGALQSAACTGALLAVIAFAVGLGLTTVRARARRLAGRQ